MCITTFLSLLFTSLAKFQNNKAQAGKGIDFLETKNMQVIYTKISINSRVGFRKKCLPHCLILNRKITSPVPCQTRLFIKVVFMLSRNASTCNNIHDNKSHPSFAVMNDRLGCCWPGPGVGVTPDPSDEVLIPKA